VQQAGLVGEVKSVNVTQASAVAETSSVAVAVGNVVLTAGNWACTGSVWTNPAAGTTTSVIYGAINTSVGLTADTRGLALSGSSKPAGIGDSVSITPKYFNLSAATTTVYLVADTVFAVSTMGVYGNMNCLRYM
jgi:hypothetical protein